MPLLGIARVVPLERVTCWHCEEGCWSRVCYHLPMLCARSAGTAAKKLQLGTSADSKMWSRFQHQVLCSWHPWEFPEFVGSTVTFFTSGQLLLQVASYLSRMESDAQRSPEIKGLLPWFICFYSCSVLIRSPLSAVCHIVGSMFTSGISSALFRGVALTWPKWGSFLQWLDMNVLSIKYFHDCSL